MYGSVVVTLVLALVAISSFQAHASPSAKEAAGMPQPVSRVIDKEAYISPMTARVLTKKCKQRRSPVDHIKDQVARWNALTNEVRELIADSRVNLAAGAFGKAVAVTITHPVDTIKTRAQLTPERLAQMPKTHIYSGVKTSLFGAVPYGALTFASYEVIKKKMLETFSGRIRPEPLLVASAIMGDMVGSLWYLPAEMVKMGRQSGMYDCSFSAARGIMDKSGFGGFYQGLPGHLLRDVPFRAIQLPVYDLIKSAWLEHKNDKAKKEHIVRIEKKRRERELEMAVKGKNTPLGKTVAKLKTKAKQSRVLNREEAADLLMETFRADEVLNPLDSMIVGTLASTVASIFTTPLDLLRTRLMTAPNLGTDVGFLTTGRELVKIANDIVVKEGPAEFFRGTFLRVAYMGPCCGIFFFAYEQAKAEIIKHDQRKLQLAKGKAGVASVEQVQTV